MNCSNLGGESPERSREMTKRRPRRNHSTGFKAKVALAAVVSKKRRSGEGVNRSFPQKKRSSSIRGMHRERTPRHR